MGAVVASSWVEGQVAYWGSGALGQEVAEELLQPHKASHFLEVACQQELEGQQLEGQELEGLKEQWVHLRWSCTGHRRPQWRSPTEHGGPEGPEGLWRLLAGIGLCAWSFFPNLAGPVDVAPFP